MRIHDAGNILFFKPAHPLIPRTAMNCKSKKLIYCMTNPICDDDYIGQTRAKLAGRMRAHKQQIRDPSVRNTPCSGHFDICGKGFF